MTTCTHCGADAVDATGVCRVCGWQAPPEGTAALPRAQGATPGPSNLPRFGPQAAPQRDDGRDSVPSLGSTRAAQATHLAQTPPAPGASAAGHPGRGAPPSPAGSPMGTPQGGGAETRQPPVPPGLGAGLPPVAAPGYAPGNARFCGNCGARIEPGRAFCGQCGTPISANGPGGVPGMADLDDRTSRLGPSASYLAEYPTEYPTEDGRYRVGGNQPWDDDLRGDAPTEMFADAVTPGQGYGRGQYGTPSGMYGGMGALSARSNAPALEPPSGSARTARILLGLICLLGSVVSAVAAIILAIHAFS